MTTYNQKPCEFKYKIDSCSKVVDGDTVDVLIDLGFDVLIRQRVTIARYRYRRIDERVI